MNNPSLIEPEAKYFFRETLKHCHQKNIEFYNNLFNLLLLLLFTSVVGGFLYYKSKSKPTIIEKIQKEKTKKLYVLNTFKRYNHNMIKKSKNLITNLPMYKNEFNV